MTDKAHRLPGHEKLKTTPPFKRNAWPLRLAGPIVTGVAVLAIIAGIVLLSNLGRGSSGTGNPAQVTGRPELAVGQALINFGKVPLDKPVKATFKLSNVGDQPLQILNQPVVEVKQGC
jgi:hypothetical protein